jgi:hypothetical protein
LNQSIPNEIEKSNQLIIVKKKAVEAVDAIEAVIAFNAFIAFKTSKALQLKYPPSE